jgi:hypothetical protein
LPLSDGKTGSSQPVGGFRKVIDRLSATARLVLVETGLGMVTCETPNIRNVNQGKEKIMKRIIGLLGIVAIICSTPALAAVKPCEELKAELEAKLKEKGVNGFTLEIIPADQVKEQKIVGSCEGGAKKISYSRK